MTVEKLISPLIPYQFPAFYRDDGATFVAFVRAYFEFLESQERFRIEYAPGANTNFSIGANVVSLKDPLTEYITVGHDRGAIEVMGNDPTGHEGQDFYEIIKRYDQAAGMAYIAPNSVIVTGNNTSFLTDFNVGSFALLGGELREIVKISDDETLIVAEHSCGCEHLEPITRYDLGAHMEARTIERRPNPLGMARDLMEHSDIDTTLKGFLTYFKREYMSSFPETIAADRRLAIKHVLDLYRAKGTKRGVALLFRILFNEDIDIYEPWRYVFSPSAANWFIPQYIEVNSSPYIWQLDGKKIRGDRYGATAIVESVTRRQGSSHAVWVITLSSLQGRFHRTERILCEDIPQMIGDAAPLVLGSLSAISVTQGGSDFEIGHILDVYGTGFAGKARVIGIREQSGILKFTLESGGTGYTVNSVVTVEGTGVGGTFEVGSLSNLEVLTIGTDVISDYANLQLDANASGFLINVQSNTGNLQVGENAWATQNVTPLLLGPGQGIWQVGELLSNGSVNAIAAVVDEDFALITKVNGTLTVGLALLGNVTGATRTIDYVYPEEIIEANGVVDTVNATHVTISNVVTISNQYWHCVNVGIAYGGNDYSNGDYLVFDGVGNGGLGWIVTDNIGSVIAIEIQDSGEYYTSAPNVVITTNTGTNANLTPVGVEQRGGYFTVSMEITGLTSGANMIAGYVSRQTDWGMPSLGTDNLDSELMDALSYEEYIVGSIASLTNINPGNSYSANPNVYVVEPIISAFQLSDGEGGFMGNNAIVTAKGISGNGIITAVDVYDSGFAYEAGEPLSMTNADNPTEVLGRAVVDLSGQGAGMWRDVRSRPSALMHIQDSYYYQRFAYEVIAPRMLDTYEQFMNELMHPTGFNLFGRYSIRDTANTAMITMESSVTQS